MSDNIKIHTKFCECGTEYIFTYHETNQKYHNFISCEYCEKSILEEHSSYNISYVLNNTLNDPYYRTISFLAYLYKLKGSVHLFYTRKYFLNMSGYNTKMLANIFNKLVEDNIICTCPIGKDDFKSVSVLDEMTLLDYYDESIKSYFESYSLKNE